MNHEKKYLKYKSKYLYLKNIQENYQKGGANNYILDLERYDNSELQKNIKKKCLLLKNTNINDLPFNCYNKMLEKLMVTNADGEINLEFINTISAFPIELGDELSIKSNGKDKDGNNKYKFDEKSIKFKDLEYTINDKTISDGITGSEAIILKLDKNKPDNVDPNATVIDNNNIKPKELVLKLMPINKSNYYNYTPLTFQHIIPNLNKSFFKDARYYQYSSEYYNKLKLDENYNGHNVNDKDEKIFITAADLDDFKNEMIQNIICRNILGRDNENLINYYNYIYIKVDGKDYGGILMESVDGSLDDYLENNEEIFNNDIFSTSLDEYLTNLDKLKLPQYRFNHSDLKVQNVFYKIGEYGKLILKIADLDKSSITFNGIRFINGKFINKNIDFINVSLSNLEKKDNFLMITESKLRTRGNIEFEQIFFRYSFFPPPPFLDMLMLFITLRIYYYNNIDNFKVYFNKKDIFNKYIGDNYDIVKQTSAVKGNLGTLKGETDFGKILMQTLIVNSIEIPLSYNNNINNINNINNVKGYVNKEIKLSKNNKLIVYGPSNFKINTIKVTGMFSESNEWVGVGNNNIEIFYTGNYPPDAKKTYYKTNRYTQGVLLALLYEYYQAT